MKILQIGKFYPIIGGIEKVMYDLTSGMADHDVECDMLCANNDTTEKKLIIKELSRKNRIIICPTLKKLFSTMLSPRMISELKHRCNSYDIIHIHHPDPMAAVALYFSNYKGKVVLHWHSDIIKQAKLLKLYAPLQSWLVRRANTIVGTTPVYIANSTYLKDVQDKCTFLPIGINDLKWSESEVERIRSQYPGKKIIFSLGRLVEYKGYQYLIESAKHLSDEYIILIGGAGPLRDSMQQQIDAENLNDKVKLLGRVSEEDLPNYFHAIDIYCLSSMMKTEAFAIVQVEAMSCCKPVVSTRIPGSGVPWVNAHQESGLTVEICSSKALSDAFKAILEDDNLYQKLAQGARKRYETMFRKEVMISKCLDIYRTTIQTGSL